MAAKTKAKAEAKPSGEKGQKNRRGKEGHWVTVKTIDGGMRPLFLEGPRHGQTAAQKRHNAATLRGSGGIEREHAAGPSKGNAKTLHGARSVLGKAGAAHNRGVAAKPTAPKVAPKPAPAAPATPAKATPKPAAQSVATQISPRVQAAIHRSTKGSAKERAHRAEVLRRSHDRKLARAAIAKEKQRLKALRPDGTDRSIPSLKEQAAQLEAGGGTVGGTPAAPKVYPSSYPIKPGPRYLRAGYDRRTSQDISNEIGPGESRRALARQKIADRAASRAGGIPAARLKAARESLAKPVPEATRAKVLGAIHSLDNQAATGAPVSVKELRAKLAADLPKKSQFDRTMRKLTEEGHLTSHRYDNAYAHGTSPAQRAAMVRRPAVGTPKGPGESRRTRESHYNAVSLGPEARKAAAPKLSEGGFSLKQERNSQSKAFESTGKGKTPVMFEEMRGANARDLPGQKTMFGQRADLLTKPVGQSTVRAAVESAKKNSGAKRDKLAATIKAHRKEIAEARAASVRDVHPDTIHFDPERFQYKLNAEQGTGSVGSLHGVKKWDPELGGVLQVWKDPANGKTYVVNGHNRLDLAKRLGATKVSVRHIVAADAAHARAKGAITNISEGRGNSTDAAQFFRDTGETRSGLETRGVPLREKIVTEGLALSGLEEGLWRQHKAGDLSANRAAIIGGSGLTHAQQAAVAKSSGKGGVASLNDKELKAYVEHAKAAPTVKNRTLDLFGANEEDINLGAFRAKAETHITDRLGKEKRVFGTVAKSGNAADLERAGNTINVSESGKVAQTASENLHVFHTLKNRRGPVSDLLNEAAERVHKGEAPRKVHDEIYRRLPKAIQEMLRGG